MTGPMDGDHGQPQNRRVKSSAAFRTISEVASELDLPPHVLRFWESKFNQVRPLKRGGGRRYYRPEDVDLLRRIRELLYTEGYTIKGVQKLFREGRGKILIQTGVAQNEEPDGEMNEPGQWDKRAELEAAISELKSLRGLLETG